MSRIGLHYVEAAKQARAMRGWPWLVVSVQPDCDLSYDEFESYESAVAFLETIERKACIVGPEWVEDRT